MKKNTLLVIAALLFSIFGHTMASAQKNDFNKGWKIISSVKVKHDGGALTSKSVDTKDWYSIDLPATVMAGLVQNGMYKDMYRDTNLEKIDTVQFLKPWWYLKEFDLDFNKKTENVDITFEGVNYKANIWLNGVKIADSKQIEGAYKVSNLNITKHLKKHNVLAVEVIPPHDIALTIGYVDWNPHPVDENMGLWRGVKIKKSGKVTLKETFVDSKVNIKTLKEAELSVTTLVTNNSDKSVTTLVEGVIGNIKFSKKVALKANESKRVLFDAKEFNSLHVKNPKLWWPLNMGEPNLHNLTITSKLNGRVSDKESVRFGIRQVSDYINPNGYRGYKVNGKKVLIRGGGWVDDLNLSDSPEKVKAQVQYVKHMGLNTIRLEGFWGNDKTLFDACDENGILLMIGLSCHWEWEAHCGRKQGFFMSVEKDEEDMVSDWFVDQVKWLNNHPSVYVWVFGSDRLCAPSLEKKLIEKIRKHDKHRPFLGTCRRTGEQGDQISSVTGDPAIKMQGPYGYVTPNYWYYDKKGGAYGYNTETGPGAQIPPLESMKKMLSDEHIWPPTNKVWEYHNGRSVFQDLSRFMKFFDERYGKSDNVEDFCYRVQMSNYEAIKAMFEAFAVRKPNATGVIQWMLNSAWPETYWQLYDWYLMPNGAFYGTKTACQPVNLIYDYKNNSVHLTSEVLENLNELNASIVIYDINSKILFSKDLKVNAKANISKEILKIPEIKGLTKTYFLSMKLTDSADKKVAENFYWLSTKEDVLVFEKSNWWNTPVKSYADLRQLNSMPKVKLDVKHKFTDGKVEVAISNPSDKIAMFVELSVKDKTTNKTILPVFWNDNYVSIMPGETKVFTATYSDESVDKSNLKFSYKGLNLK